MTRRVVVTDTNILINLAHIDRLDLLGRLDGYEFVAPVEVLHEVTRDEARSRLANALLHGYLQETPLDRLEALTLFAELRQILGRGESACLAMASTRDWFIASVEKRVFLREAQRLVGPGRILNTPGLLLLAIRRGLLTVNQADEAKEVLERCRFRMAVASFRELL